MPLDAGVNVDILTLKSRSGIRLKAEGGRTMLREALLFDAAGNPIRQHHKVFSRDWDEIRDWSTKVYMPYNVAPTGGVMKPSSTMHSAMVGASPSRALPMAFPSISATGRRMRGMPSF